MAVLPTGIGPVTGYQIERSLRFDGTAYLNRTLTASSTSSTTYAWSGWVKRSTLAAARALIAYHGNTAGNGNMINVEFVSDTLRIFFDGAGSTGLQTTAVYRDPSAWYHIILAYDSTQTTPSNRAKLYVNGIQITVFSTANYPALNQAINAASTNIQLLGATVGLANFFSGYMTEINFIDGYPTGVNQGTWASFWTTNCPLFGETDANTGVWKPKSYTGTYGTNGFFLKFADNSNTTAATLGKDSSGNGNNWTPNGFSVTAGTDNDSLVDSPTAYGTDTGVGGTVRGNYCVLNTLSRSISTNAPTPTNGNLEYATPAGVNTTGWPFVLGSIGISSGKWYFEVDITGLEADSVAAFGFVQTTIVNDSDNTDQLDKIIGAIIRNDSASTGLRSAVLGTYVTRDGADATDAVYQIAIDNDLGKLWIGKANTWYASGNPSAGTNEIGTFTSQSLIPLAMLQKSNTTGDSNLRYNFGQRAFAHTAPSGFKALCTQNLPPVTIGATSTTQADDYFNAVLYSGNSSTQNITVGFQPDFVWSKCRNVGRSHRLIDSVRGLSYQLFSDATSGGSTYDATSYASSITSTSSSGFAITNAGTDQYNTSGETYVSWAWNAGGSNQTISVGQYATSPANVPSIASTVRANTTSGFSIVTFTTNNTAGATVGHGCQVGGVATTPDMIIMKYRGLSANWVVYHKSMNATPQNGYLNLNTTANYAALIDPWNNTAPSSTVITMGAGAGSAGSTNYGVYTSVAYCFAAVPGYSAFGSYTGNGDPNGPFVYTGFRPRWIMIKNTQDNTTSWSIWDTSRSTFNLGDQRLEANAFSVESSLAQFDILSNGFKLRSSNSNNASGQTIIFAAFAETPFKYSLAR